MTETCPYCFSSPCICSSAFAYEKQEQIEKSEMTEEEEPCCTGDFFLDCSSPCPDCKFYGGKENEEVQ